MPTWLIILIVILLFGGIGGAPTWGYHQYGWGPSGGVGLILLIILLVLFLR
jgi:hypothetical protein